MLMVFLYVPNEMRFPSQCANPPPINSPTPADAHKYPIPAGPRLNTSSPNRLNRIWAAPPPDAHPTASSAIPRISGDDFMYRSPSVYSCQGRTTSPSVSPFARRTRKLPSFDRKLMMLAAENKNDI